MPPRVVAKVNAEGLYVEDVLVRDGAPTPPGCIEQRPPEGLHRPRWTGSAGGWTEGMAQGEIAEALKPQKLEEMHAAALEELSPLFTEDRGKDELIFVLAAHVRQICGALGVPVDPRLAAVETVGEKALQKRDEVEAATSPEELESIVWEEQTG